MHTDEEGELDEEAQDQGELLQDTMQEVVAQAMEGPFFKDGSNEESSHERKDGKAQAQEQASLCAEGSRGGGLQPERGMS